MDKSNQRISNVSPDMLYRLVEESQSDKHTHRALELSLNKTELIREIIRQTAKCDFYQNQRDEKREMLLAGMYLYNLSNSL